MGRYSWIPDDPPRDRDPSWIYDFPAEALSSAAEEGRRKSVCVIGAGIAGLVAAYELLQAGHSVTVVEADDRVGGRIRTWHFGGVHAELGPMRIPLGHRGTMHYVKEMGCSIGYFVQANAAAWLALRGGKERRVDWRNLLSRYEPQNALFLGRQARTFTTPADALAKAIQISSITLKEAEVWQLVAGTLGPRATQLASQTFWQAIIGSGPVGGKSMVTDLGWELVGQATSAIREERVSGLEAWVEENWTFGSGPRFRLTEGMEALPVALRSRIEALGATVHVDSPVARVVSGDDDVRVICAGGEPALEPFDYVICAVPAAPTRRIEFEPPLDGKKDDALGDISYFSAAKSLVFVKQRRWELEDEIYGGASYTDRSIQQCWYPSDNARIDPDVQFRAAPRGDRNSWDFGTEHHLPRDPDLSRSPAILTAAYMSGTNAERFTSLTEAQRDDEVLRHLEFLHPGIGDDVEETEHCCWIEESMPHGGAWTIFEPGKQERYHDGLCAAHPVGDRPRVFFAGEHLAVLHGWMQSAILSSLQAVFDVFEAP